MSEITQQLGELAGQWIVQESEVTITSATQGTLLVPANSRRWALWVAPNLNSPTARFGISTLAQVTSGQALAIDVANLPWQINFRRWGGLVQQAWYAYATGGSVTVHVIELLMQQ